MAVAAAAPGGGRAAAAGGGAQDTIGWVLRMILISWTVSTFMGFAQKSLMPDQSQLPRGAGSEGLDDIDANALAQQQPPSAMNKYKGEIFNGANERTALTGSFWITGDDNATRTPVKLPPGLMLGSFETVELTQDLNLSTCAVINCTLQLAYRILLDGGKFVYEGQTPIVFFEKNTKSKKRRLLDAAAPSSEADKDASPSSAALLLGEAASIGDMQKIDDDDGDVATKSSSKAKSSQAAAVSDEDTVVWDVNGIETVMHKDVVIATGARIEPYKAKFQQRVTFSAVNDFRPWSQIPPQMHSLTSLTPDGRFYKPMIYVDNFWVMPSHRLEFNASSDLDVLSANLTIEVRPSSFWRTIMLTQWDISLNSVGVGEAEKMKKIFIETNPILLGVTMVVSILHLVFEYLAFSNDISFWKNKKDYKGLSLKTIALNCYFQTIIFLYLFDAEETSWTVLGPAAIGVAIEYWKLRKTVTVEKDSLTGKWKMHFKSSYDKRTRRFDDSAMRYLFIAMVPCMIGYTIYSALYEDHKGWYSFVIATQVRFIYLFGFVMMTPQIFVNYKMKSVTQLPWRTFVYKALNTFIDDLFAFIITMPTMHRLACFRDDIIFFILLYQRWIYKVDLSRTQQDSGDEQPALAEPEEIGHSKTMEIAEGPPNTAATKQKMNQEVVDEGKDEPKLSNGASCAAPQADSKEVPPLAAAQPPAGSTSSTSGKKSKKKSDSVDDASEAGKKLAAEQQLDDKPPATGGAARRRPKKVE